MVFDNIGKIIFHNEEYASEEIRNRINRVKSSFSELNFQNKRIAIAVKRDENLLVLLFALIESNITFLPIDLELPPLRIKYMLDNADIKDVVVSDNNDTFKDYNTYTIDKLLSKDSVCNEILSVSEKKNPVYILYTSGSTGNPKAVVVNYKGFFNFLNTIPDIIDFKSFKTIACFTTVSFDIFFLEAVLGLSLGLTVVLADENEKNNPKNMIDLLRNHKVQLFQTTPSRLKLMGTYEKSFAFLKDVQILMIGGEKLSADLLKQIKTYTEAKIYNMYGPTETTIWSSVSDLTNETEVSIGQPVGNTRIYILKNRNEEAEEGEEGEICIAGDGVSDGYLGQPELTAKTFIQLPVKPFEKIYCTGDLGFYSGDKYYCLGRIDNQVKVRGYRIELEEIEASLRNIPEVIDAVCCVKDSTDSIIAFYKADEDLDKSLITAELSKHLPDYMLPAAFIKTNDFILTPSGKINRKAMLDQIREPRESQTEKKQVSDGLDDVSERVSEIFKKNLELNKEIKQSEHLTELGLNSINYISIIVDLEDEFNIEFEEDYLLMEAFKTLQDMIDYVRMKKEK